MEASEKKVNVWSKGKECNRMDENDGVFWLFLETI